MVGSVRQQHVAACTMHAAWTGALHAPAPPTLLSLQRLQEPALRAHPFEAAQAQPLAVAAGARHRQV
ncbi:hypothetical protein XFF6166_860017 [Xanthomonas citri pv. fuscans]|nr:hypothetical protein XFF6166_860017 [Xanthomonas citri pv. fuscans]SOO03502.1 hypothetical protein XFF6960_860031 [Xanthomonas citri pv. fuscans]SOO06130.1 hypothetical protein XFF7767_640032 [Xanthomonas citri pv. fuscans]SOO10160.1 hypothetical protein XFF6970_500019 [Xanthomonas citri pv. fuscans]SOO15760.1 hypothetical protein XFF7766_620032 [Xanthomonas citri pv. fuscans]